MSGRETRRAHWPGQALLLGTIAEEMNSMGDQGWLVRDVSQDPDEYRYWELYRQGDGLALSVSFLDEYLKAGERPRIGFRLVWPRNAAGEVQTVRTPYGEKEPTTEISVDAARPAKTIAGEVLRRLVRKDGARLFAAAKQRADDGDQAEAARRQTVAMILKAIPGSHTSRNTGPYTIYMDSGHPMYQLRVDAADSVRIEAFSTDARMALLLAETAAAAIDA